MSKEKARIGKAIVLLYENYIKAQELDFVKKPISYALYKTWEYMDSVENVGKQ